MNYLDPVSQWKREEKLAVWIGKTGTVVSVTGDAKIRQYVLLNTEKGNVVVPVMKLSAGIKRGDRMQIWLGQQAVLDDGRIMHGLIAQKI